LSLQNKGVACAACTIHRHVRALFFLLTGADCESGATIINRVRARSLFYRRFVQLTRTGAIYYRVNLIRLSITVGAGNIRRRAGRLFVDDHHPWKYDGFGKPHDYRPEFRRRSVTDLRRAYGFPIVRSGRHYVSDGQQSLPKRMYATVIW